MRDRRRASASARLREAGTMRRTLRPTATSKPRRASRFKASSGRPLTSVRSTARSEIPRARALHRRSGRLVHPDAILSPYRGSGSVCADHVLQLPRRQLRQSLEEPVDPVHEHLEELPACACVRPRFDNSVRTVLAIDGDEDRIGIEIAGETAPAFEALPYAAWDMREDMGERMRVLEEVAG